VDLYIYINVKHGNESRYNVAIMVFFVLFCFFVIIVFVF
jgi:hypothetical protein